MLLNLRCNRWRFATICALAPAALLGGCAVAVVAPVLAAGTMVAASEKNDRTAQGQAAGTEARDTPAPRLTLVDPAAFTPTRPSQSVDGFAMTSEGWQTFVDFALEKSRALQRFEPVPSALLAPGSTIGPADRLPCRNQSAGVMIDLDQGNAIFAPSSDSRPAPGLAERLARLRDAGVVVMWVSGADANGVGAIGDVLRNSGLDPTGKDPLLLVRSPEERKQVMRAEANQFACVIAIAGDRRGDFDELFDYLRNPDYALGLDAMLGDGWFIVPPPLGEAAAD